jgi:CDP-6-deoxy-D-xylo-4-hexulose-3-dehydrase
MKQELKNLLTDYYDNNLKLKPFIPGESAVPVSGKIFDEKELILMTEAVLDGWWTEEKYSLELENKIATYLGTKYCALVNSGSSANLLAISVLTSKKIPEEKRLKPGDEVITTAAAFPTTVNPIIQHNLVPVFIDVDLKYGNPDLKSIIKAYSKKTKAIFIAHTLGNPFAAEEIAEFCKEKNIWLIEDNCDAFGSEYKHKKTGTFGDISTLSFYPAHHITTAEGGAVLTSSPLLHKIIKSIRDWGRDCWCPTGKDDTCHNRFNWQLGNLPNGYDHKYIYSELGYNLKMTDIQAALGLAQMDKLENFIKKRRENFQFFMEKLKIFENFFNLPDSLHEADPSWFGFLITIKNNSGIDRTELLKFLNAKKIGTRLLFAGNIVKQPYFIDGGYNYRLAEALKNTDYIMNNSFWIGVCPGVNEEMRDYVISCFTEFFNSKKL